MIFTPRARRRISDAVQTLDPASESWWKTWAHAIVPNHQADAPPDMALIALRSLIRVEQKIEERLNQEVLDDDLKADLLNDLGYVRGIKAALLKEPSR